MFVDGWWVTAATVKGVVRLGDDVLLGRNSRGEWELPGGRPEPDEESVAAVLRASEEHSELGWFAIDRLPEPLPELYRRAIDLG